MKKVLGLAAAGLLAAGAAQAGNITVANTDMVLYGGVSAAYDYSKTDVVKPSRKDQFHVTTFAVGLMKKADADKSPIGFNAAIASFDAPTVIASSYVVNNANSLLSLGGKEPGLIKHGQTSGSFKPWLAYVTLAPVEGLSVDAGLIWNKFGEAPLTILNPNYTRGILFTGHPVAYAGARVNYDAGVAKVYVGYNQGGGLRQGSTAGYNVKDAIEAGIMANLGAAKLALHTYNEASGRDLYVACVKADAGVAKVGLEIDYTKLDKKWRQVGKDDKAYGIALNINPVISDQVSIPIRIEYVDNKTSGIYLTGNGKAKSFTITPTWKPTKNTFARVEAAYTKTDGNTFVDDKGTAKSSRTVLSFEAGFLF